jgi:NAD(P)-dependent dehydrogenase (short-subunit alcohol dehydrogenase family)
MKDLYGKSAIITGGGSGINLALAQLLVKSGCNVLIADLRLHPTAQEWIQTLSQVPENSSSRPGRVEFVQTDVTLWPQLERTFEVCARVFNAPCPDIVVPGAGIYESLSATSPVSFWADTDMDHEFGHYKVLDINLVHPIKMTRIAIRKFVEKKNRSPSSISEMCVVHVSSIAGQRSSMVTPLYQASKHGINSFVRGMATLQSILGFRVVGVAPG